MKKEKIKLTPFNLHIIENNGLLEIGEENWYVEASSLNALNDFYAIIAPHTVPGTLPTDSNIPTCSEIIENANGTVNAQLYKFIKVELFKSFKEARKHNIDIEINFEKSKLLKDVYISTNKGIEFTKKEVNRIVDTYICAMIVSAYQYGEDIIDNITIKCKKLEYYSDSCPYATGVRTNIKLGKTKEFQMSKYFKNM